MFNPGWNEKVIKTISKADFVKMHQHLKHDVDLEAEYDKIVPPKEKPIKKEVPAEKSS